MKLEHFVAETLKQIINGVIEAQEHATQLGAHVNPVNAAFSSSNSTNIIYCSETGIPLQQVEFDVAVTVSESSGDSSNNDLRVGNINVSGNASDKHSSNSTASRIKFSVPVRLPVSGKVTTETY